MLFIHCILWLLLLVGFSYAVFVSLLVLQLSRCMTGEERAGCCSVIILLVLFFAPSSRYRGLVGSVQLGYF